MTYQELVGKIKKDLCEADVSRVQEHIAYQFNIRGEAEGAFYAEILQGQLKIEPYEYYDRDVLITTTAETLLAVAEGRMDAEEAFSQGKLHAEGDFAKVMLLFNFCKIEKLAQQKAINKPEAAEAAESGSADAAQVKEEVKKPAARKTAAGKGTKTAGASKTAKTAGTSRTSKAKTSKTAKAAKTEEKAED